MEGEYRLSLALVLALISLLNVPKNEAIIVKPLTSITNACPGDIIVIMCNLTGGSFVLDWIWRNRTIIYERYRFFGSSNEMLNVNHNFTGVPGVTVTLLENNNEVISSSLQFIVSKKFKSARIECRNDYRDITVQDASASTTTFKIADVDFGVNKSSFNLVWNASALSTLSYQINVINNFTNIISLVTNNSFVQLNLENEQEYLVDVSILCCNVTCKTYSIELLLSECNNSCRTFCAQLVSPENELILTYECPNEDVSTSTYSTTDNSTYNTSTTRREKENSTQVLMSTFIHEMETTDRAIQQFLGIIVGSFSGIFFLAIAILLTIVCVTLLYKKRNKEKGNTESVTTPADLEYDHFRFEKGLHKHIEPDEYGTLNTDTIPQSHFIDEEEYSTITRPHLRNCALERGDYEYSKINCRSYPKEEKVTYAVLETNSTENGNYDVQTDNIYQNNEDVSNINYSLVESFKVAGKMSDERHNISDNVVENEDMENYDESPPPIPAQNF